MRVLLQLNSIHKSYGPDVILDDVTLSVNEGQKIGVIGRNGAGKSTLCKIITGHEEADSGTVSKSAHFRLAYLEQHDPYTLDETVLNFLTRYTSKEEWECGKIAARFQLKNELLTTPIGELSGGYRTRVKLTSMLLAEPNFLILDEPTNYLDLKTLILFEEFLNDYQGGFFVVSHDREFLKKTCKHTLEIENGECTLYPGNVEQFLIFKEEQKSQAESYNKNILTKQKQLQKFVDRFRAKASKASQARSKMKQIESMKTIEIGHPLGNVKIKIPQVPKRKGVSLWLEDLHIGYPDLLVAKDITMEISQGSHVAILGDNGQGKTTFLRTIAEDLESLGGTYRWSISLNVGYYAQHVYEKLNPQISVYDHLIKVADSSVTSQEVLDIAGSFLFKGLDVKKKVSILSGGERARLCLAGLLLTKCQVLLLDEPTNHLDFETVEALGEALKEFDGTLFFISHDRTFVNWIATEIIEIENGSVKKYAGKYEDYVYHLEQNVREEFSQEPIKGKERSGTKNGSVYQKRKELRAKKRKFQTALKKTTATMDRHKKEHGEINQSFIDDPNAWSHEQNARLESLTKKIENDENKWIEITEKMEALDKKLDAL